MNLKLKPREQLLIFIAFLALIFMLCWYLFLSPLLLSIRKAEAEIKGLELQLKNISSVFSVDAAGLSRAAEFKIYPREEQLNHILGFMDKKFRWFGDGLISLNQSSADNLLTIELKFKSTDVQFLSLLSSLSELNTLLVIDKVRVTQAGDSIVTEMKIISGHL